MLPTLLIACVTALSSAAFAVESPGVPRLPDTGQATEVLREAVEQGKSAIEQAKAGMDRSQLLDPLMRASGIADPVMARHRERLLNAMGLSETKGRVYIFVSTSMGTEMLRAYADDAWRIGGILVVRGLPEGETIQSFMTGELAKVVNPTGRQATIQIDPRLFDAFEVSAVPTIVFTTAPSLDICSAGVRRTGKVGESQFSYKACRPLTPDDYWKVSGAVTTLWALEAFQDKGAPVADHIAAFKRHSVRATGIEQRGMDPVEWFATDDPALRESVKAFAEHYGQETQK